MPARSCIASHRAAASGAIALRHTLALALCATGCHASGVELVQPVGETHTNPSSTGGGRPRGHDEPSSAIGVVVGDEVRRACMLPQAPPEVPRFEVEAEHLRPVGEDDPLTRVAACIAAGKLGGAKVWVIGHADPRGPAEYNYSLGLYRASGTKRHLISLGVPETRMAVESRGAENAKGTDETSWAGDRRVEVHLASGLGRPFRRDAPRGGRRR